MVRTKISSPLLILVFGVIAFLTYQVTAPLGNTPHNYFVRLASAFLEGRYWIQENPPWLSELIPASQGRFYVPYPPMPAVLLMPFVYIWGSNFPQQIFAHLVGAGIGITSGAIAYEITRKKVAAYWMALAVSFGSIIWFLSSVGSVWYTGQLVSCLFLSLAILSTLKNKSAALVGLMLGIAYLSRVHVILSFPVFVYLLMKNGLTKRQVLGFIIVLGSFVCANFLYNYVRFGSIFDKGYFLIPGVLDEPWFSKGLAHPSYIPMNLKTMFWSFPKRVAGMPYIQPSWYGLSIWITSPFMVLIFLAKRTRETLAHWTGALVIMAVVLMHGSNGFAQFGYRFAVDAYPFLVTLLAYSIKRTNMRWYHFVLLVVAFLVNIWGVLWINRFGWVGF